MNIFTVSYGIQSNTKHRDNLELCHLMITNLSLLFLDEICEQLFKGTGTLLIREAVHKNIFNNLSITLKKAKTLNLQYFVYVEAMEPYPSDFLVLISQ